MHCSLLETALAGPWLCPAPEAFTLSVRVMFLEMSVLQSPGFLCVFEKYSCVNFLLKDQAIRLHCLHSYHFQWTLGFCHQSHCNEILEIYEG